MVFRLTKYCNYKCPHCMIDADKNGNHAEFKVVEELCNFFNNTGSKFLIIAGGEPTQHPLFIEILTYILEHIKSNDNIMIVVASNGSFMWESDMLLKLKNLYKYRKFGIQISSIKGLYQKHKKTKARFKTLKYKFQNWVLIEELQIIDKLGRAATMTDSDIKKHSITFRKGPNCFNLFSGSWNKQISTLPSLIQILESKISSKGLSLNLCKPSIDETGIIYMGETSTCVSVGSIFDDYNDILTNMSNNKPCGKCGIDSKDLVEAVKIKYESSIDSNLYKFI